MLRYSIIIPVYNCEGFLKECIQSIAGQIGHDDEIILVDDGSTDQSGKICDSFCEGYNNIKVFHKKNSGVASARNVGIKEARGRFILFVDGDDTIEPDTLNHLSSNNRDSDLVVFGMSFDYYRKGKCERSVCFSCQECGTILKDEVLKNFNILFYNNVFSSACNKVFLRNIIMENNLLFDEEMSIYEDLEFSLRYSTFCNSFTFFNQPFYHYRIDADTSISSRLKQLSSICFNMEKVLSTLNVFSSGDKKINSIGTNMYLQLLYHNMMYSEWDEESVLDYCKLPVFKELADSGCLNKTEKDLLDKIMKGDFSKIRKELRLKQTKIFLKRTIKRLLNK